jgi:general secretion pathway protein D
MKLHFRLATAQFFRHSNEPSHNVISPVAKLMTRLPSLVSRTPIVLIATISSFVSPFAIQAGDTPGGLSGIAEREIARRMGRMEDARQAIERGDKAYAEGDFETALGQYKAAIEALPDAPTTQEWRTLAKAKFADASVALAKERAKNGRYAEAQQLLDGALAINSEHKGAKLLKKQLDDPDRYPPALTPEHVAKVERVQRGLQMANSEQDLGKFDEANKEFQKTLLDDQYNIAARRGMERTEQMRSEYFDAARDHQRARMLNLVSEGWEDKVPVAVTNVDSGVGSITQNAGKYLSIKMKSIVFPQVSFTGATIDEAVEYLRVKSRDLDTTEPDPTRRGVNIILKAGETPSAATITLDLKDVPMEEALRYIVELAGMKFKVEPFAVLVVPISESTTEQFTRIYKVPPDFQTMSGSDGAAPAAAPDPFAAAPAGGAAASTLKPKAGAKDILTAQGIPFPEGASAVFNPVNSQLIVKNTQPNLDMVETFVDSLKDKAPKQIYITTKFVEVSQKNTDELGFDWLLGPFSVPGSDRVFGTGGTLGNSPNGSLQNQSGATVDFPFLNPGAGSSPIGNNPVSRGLRFGSSAIAPDSIDGLISASAAVSSVSPGIFALSGVLTDPQFQVVVRALNQKKGVDLMSAPSVTTKGGQRATIEVIREFIYPTEFDPPQIPQQFGGNAGGTSNILTGASSQGSFPVTPTTPTAFEMKPIGVRMEVDPVVGPDGYTIDLTLAPEVTEFEGFINYGSPIQTGSTDALGNPTTITLTENRIPQPIFSTRKLQTQVSVWDGQTVAMGGLIREDVQDVEDKVPLLGDLPIIGRLFQTKAEDHFKRNLMIFVTAVLIDPSGQRIKGQSVSVSPVDSGAGAVAPDPSLLGARP